MNVFYLDENPVTCAEQHCDKHVVKMPTESCQMLHTNSLYFHYKSIYGVEPSLKDLKKFHTHINSKMMKPAMLNHPSTIWARKNKANYMWLYHHAVALCKEYTYRYGKEHGSYKRILDSTIFDTVEYNPSHLTPIDIAMANEYRLDKEQYFIDNPNFSDWDYVIDCYRNYYLEGKWRFAEWSKNRRPNWFPNNWYAVKYNEGVRKYNASFPKYPMTLLEE